MWLGRHSEVARFKAIDSNICNHLVLAGEVLPSSVCRLGVEYSQLIAGNWLRSESHLIKPNRVGLDARQKEFSVGKTTLQ